MHNLHIVRVNASSHFSAQKKVNAHFNREVELDFSKLDVDPEHFKELSDPYSEDYYESFELYLEGVITPHNQMQLWEIDDQLRDNGFDETANKIDHFLSEAGFESGLDENLFSFQVLGSIDKQGQAIVLESERWDLSDLTIEKLNAELSEAYGDKIDCFGDLNSTDQEKEWDSFGITDWANSKDEDVYCVLVDVRS